MINSINIIIFDYIYDTNILISGSTGNNYQEHKNELNKLIIKVTDSENNYDFWKEHIHLFNDDSVKDTSTLSSRCYSYFEFPKMKLNTKNNYLNFKLKQLITILENNGEYVLENLYKDINIKNTVSLKALIEYFISKNILIADNDKWYKKYIDGSYGFNYDHLKINMNHFNEDDSDILNSSNKQKQQQSYTDNSTNIYVGKGNFKGNDFSKNKTEIERENIFVKIVNSITKIFKK